MNIVGVDPSTGEGTFRFKIAGHATEQTTNQLKLTRSTLPIGSKLTFWYGDQGSKNSLTVEQDPLDATTAIIMDAQLVLGPDDRQEVNVSVTPNGAGQFDFTISQYEADSLLGSVSYVVNVASV